MVQKEEWSNPVVVLTRDSDNYSSGDQIKFVVKQEFDRQFQA